jgi:hypothetical protein
MDSNNEYTQRQFWNGGYKALTYDDFKNEVSDFFNLKAGDGWVLYTKDPDIVEKINESFKKEVIKQYGTMGE